MYPPTYILILIVLSLAWLGFLRERDGGQATLDASIEQKEFFDQQPGSTDRIGHRSAPASKVATASSADYRDEGKIGSDSFTADVADLDPDLMSLLQSDSQQAVNIGEPMSTDYVYQEENEVANIGPALAVPDPANPTPFVEFYSDLPDVMNIGNDIPVDSIDHQRNYTDEFRSIGSLLDTDYSENTSDVSETKNIGSPMEPPILDYN